MNGKAEGYGILKQASGKVNNLRSILDLYGIMETKLVAWFWKRDKPRLVRILLLHTLGFYHYEGEFNQSQK